MKHKILLLMVATYSISLTLNAQHCVLYGMDYSGGTYNDGLIYSYDLSTGKDSTRYNFDGLHGANPGSGLVQASNGLIYGMTYKGGTQDSGVLFSFDPNNGNENVLINFNKISGCFPVGTLLQASNGLLYGTTYSGGIYNLGVIFSYNISTDIETILYYFDNTFGSFMSGSLTQASNGILYGLTVGGGKYNQGVIFSYDTATNIYDTLFSFNSTISGYTPYGSLKQAPNNLLYGFNDNGAKYDEGAFFSFNTTTNIFQKIFDFNDTNNGGSPDESLVQGYNGVLYGVGDDGGDSLNGSIFSYNPITGKDTINGSFYNAIGKYPYATPSLCPCDSLLYGTTFFGGKTGYGTIYSFNTTTNTLKVVEDSAYLADNDGSLLILQETSVGINNQSSFYENIQIYPNPFLTETTISFAQSSVYHFELEDEFGRKVFETEFEGKHYYLKRNNLANGIYFIKAIDKQNAHTFYSKLIIQ